MRVSSAPGAGSRPGMLGDANVSLELRISPLLIATRVVLCDLA
jgi:hypothetical protein